MIVWALLLIPIILCLAQTIYIYASYGGFERYQFEWWDEYEYSRFCHDGKELVNLGACTFSFLIYSFLTIGIVLKLSWLKVQSNRKVSLIYSLIYSFLSMIFYFAIIYAIVYWTSHVMPLIWGDWIPLPERLQNNFLVSFIFYLVLFLLQFILYKCNNFIIEYTVNKHNKRIIRIIGAILGVIIALIMLLLVCVGCFYIISFGW